MFGSRTDLQHEQALALIYHLKPNVNFLHHTKNISVEMFSF